MAELGIVWIKALSTTREESGEASTILHIADACCVYFHADAGIDLVMHHAGSSLHLHESRNDALQPRCRRVPAAPSQASASTRSAAPRRPSEDATAFSEVRALQARQQGDDPRSFELSSNARPGRTPPCVAFGASGRPYPGTVCPWLAPMDHRR
ncbi:hypothetical protein PANT_22c00141 [Moesziomyces antarcticus T-34]|uniref:Uncharacterized protein n=1 Tax=Pseudozyma antarctica (strain T-34) TaxID=1151754 RepID=M9M6X8_PSEA3|nr:hypothetical protein PANT_22c00141 [Moesziomyces antarcticus T-34]